MDIALLILTHSEYSDIWYLFFDRLKRHLKINFAATYLCTDDKSRDICTDFKNYYNFNDIFYYTSDMSYPNRMKEALATIKESYVLIFHDNNILVADTNVDKFNIIEKILYRDAPDQLRLHAGSARTPGIHIEEDVYKMTPHDPYKYSVYPTIWKKTSIINIFELFHYKSYRDIEDDGTQNYISQLNNYYVWNYEKSPPVGHCASELVPHVIYYRHFILRAKWIKGWNNKELEELIKEYNINSESRGYIICPCTNRLLPDCYHEYKTGHICK